MRSKAAVPFAIELSRERFDAVVFDLDGVLTATRALHARAWKSVFDGYLERRAGEAGFEPFDAGDDYERHVDGKPRYDGVRDFLASRDIELPFGDPRDPPGDGSVCAIGNRKEAEFLDLLRERGVETYSSSVELVRLLRRNGFALAMVTSSRSGRQVLAQTGLADSFTVQIDGTDIESRNLAGKPAPDLFAAAVADLHVAPERSVVIEDSLAGVEAGRAAGFGCVIGVARGKVKSRLRASGAHVVVRDLCEVALKVSPVPHARERTAELLARIGSGTPAVFLDYDGTLTPIVDRPEHALLEGPTRQALQRVAARFPTAVVSGRDVDDVRALVGLPTVTYVGSHGFDVRFPNGSRRTLGGAERAAGALDAAEAELRQRLAAIDGALVERKRFSLAAHYRLVADAQAPTVESIVNDVLQSHQGLRKGRGKCVFELLPDADWDKGRAVIWLLDELSEGPLAPIPVYFGDDVTDESAFQRIAGRGIGIVVTTEQRVTAATYRLGNPRQVRDLLLKLSEAGPGP